MSSPAADLGLSVIIPTYNRPRELERVLLSVRQQTYGNFECLVIDDGSTSEALNEYRRIWENLDERFQLHVKDPKDRSGGPGKARNTGIRLARMPFVAFCDDDDCWIRGDHLSAAIVALTTYNADFFFANLQTVASGRTIIPDWLSITPDLYHLPIPGERDLFEVTIPMLSKFFAHRNLHANMLVVSKQLITDVGMYSEDQMFGEDYDIQLRLADRARKIICRSTVTSELTVDEHPSISRAYDSPNKLLFTVLSCLRAEISVRDRTLRKRARANRGWCLLDLAKQMLQNGKRSQALEIAVQSLLLHPSAEALRVIGTACFRKRR